MVCLPVSNWVSQLQSQTSQLDVPVSSKRCRQGKRRTTWPCSTLVAGPPHLEMKKSSKPGYCEPCSFWCDALHLWWDLTRWKISATSKSIWNIHEITRKLGFHSIWGAQKTWASSSTMENFQERLRGLPWSERRTWQRRHSKVIYVIREFSEFGLKNVFFQEFHSCPSPPHNS